MEINVNKEICAYKEAVFFGLTTRQFVCSVAAVGIAVGTYFGLKGILGKETASWLCMIAALPVAAMGFFKYNSLTAEQLFWTIIHVCHFHFAPSKFCFYSICSLCTSYVILEKRQFR